MNNIRLAKVSDAEALFKLVSSLFKYISDKSLNETFKKSFSIEAFEKSISNETWFTTLVYEEDNKIVAYISLVNSSHIYHLFVEENFHKKGIAKKLWEVVLDESPSKKFTVNASLYSIDFYHKLGFINSEEQQESLGVKYQPMSFEL